MVDKQTNLAQPIVRGVSTRSKLLVIDKVQVPGDFPEAPTRDAVCLRGIVKQWISAPVVVDRW